MDTHSTLLAEEQSAQWRLPASAFLTCCSNLELPSSDAVDLIDGRSPTVACLEGVLGDDEVYD